MKDDETLKSLASARQKYDDIKGLANKDVSAIDKLFGTKGAGEQLRKLAGVRQHGSLSKKELKKMAAILAQNEALQVVEGAAKAGDTGGPEGGDDEIMAATKQLVTSSTKLAVMNNIASVLTGNETAGQKIAGIDKIDLNQNTVRKNENIHTRL